MGAQQTKSRGCCFVTRKSNLHEGVRHHLDLTGGPESAADYPPAGLSPPVLGYPDWIQLGCGDALYHCLQKGATFAADGTSPDHLPDLSSHSSILAVVLTEQPQLYALLRERSTAMGGTVAQCIKTGVDIQNTRAILDGLVAADEECYQLFHQLFDAVITRLHPSYNFMPVPTNMDVSQLRDTDVDPECKYVIGCRVRIGRNLTGFRLPSTIQFQERRQCEELVVKACLSLKGAFKGEYLPLYGSCSYPARPDGMHWSTEQSLRTSGCLFKAPDSMPILSSGVARHWPDARGVFENHEKNLFVWVGEWDHLQVVGLSGSMQPTIAPRQPFRFQGNPGGKNIKAVASRCFQACDEIQKNVVARGHEFMHHERVGFLRSRPSDLGGVTVEVNSSTCTYQRTHSTTYIPTHTQHHVRT